MSSRETIVAIDALRCRSGGAIAHLRGVILHAKPEALGIKTVHLFANQYMLDQIGDYPWLNKCCPSATTKPVWQQLLWQRYKLPRILTDLGVDVLFTADASSFARWPKHVVLSQDMLAFEPGVANLYSFGKGGFRIRAIRIAQVYALKHATVPLFLTAYARDTIQQYTGTLKNARVVPHGIDEVFREILPKAQYQNDGRFDFVYVSNSAPYKNHGSVIAAVNQLRTLGFNVHLKLIGALSGSTASKTAEMVRLVDPEESFITMTGFVCQEQIVDALTQADVFIFASECETMPVTLLEAMASGLPILCSNRGPMPEVLGDAGLYFDPHRPESLVDAATILLGDDDLRSNFGTKVRAAAAPFTWERCSRLTWDAIVTARK